MQTKIEQHVFNVIDYQNLNELIKKTYELDHYDLLEITDWYTQNVVYHKVSLKEKKFSKYENVEINNWIRDKKQHCDLNLILQDMFNSKILPEGNLLIRVYDNG